MMSTKSIMEAVSFCQKVMVLDNGMVVEFDHPFKLLAKSIEDTEMTNDSFFS